MSNAKLVSAMDDVVAEGNIDEVTAFLDDHPQLVRETNWPEGQSWLHVAAGEGHQSLVEFFLRRGIPINSLDANGQCPLSAAVHSGNTALIRWLLANGADPCLCNAPIIAAARSCEVEIVKLFVERGADYNCVFGVDPVRTPLSLALMYGRTEVADYLRSIGAQMPPGVAPADQERAHEELVANLREQTGSSPESVAMQEIVPGVVSVSVHTIVGRDHQILFTSGLSSRPMVVPAGEEELRYAELVLFLPIDWPLNPPLDGPHAWPHKWLRLMAHYPHEHDTWFGNRFVTFANGEPPQPLDTNCPFSSFLLTYDQHFRPFTTSDGRLIHWITAIPLYPEELRLARRAPHGIVELYGRFIKSNVHPGDAHPRRNVASD